MNSKEKNKLYGNPEEIIEKVAFEMGLEGCRN